MQREGLIAFSILLTMAVFAPPSPPEQSADGASPQTGATPDTHYTTPAPATYSTTTCRTPSFELSGVAPAIVLLTEHFKTSI